MSSYSLKGKIIGIQSYSGRWWRPLPPLPPLDRYPTPQMKRWLLPLHTLLHFIIMQHIFNPCARRGCSASPK
jgi:hypothetical protein